MAKIFLFTGVMKLKVMAPTAFYIQLQKYEKQNTSLHCKEIREHHSHYGVHNFKFPTVSICKISTITVNSLCI